MGGLMDYKARFCSPMLGRFLQPDILIPDQANPQAWNRFSYVINNPVNFNDPTGHRACGDGEAIDCSGRLSSPRPIDFNSYCNNQYLCQLWSSRRLKN
jgi:RHS repeat-associated protein